MKSGTKRMRRPRWRYMGFFATIAWLLPTMGFMGVAGFYLARDYFAPKFMRPSIVHGNRPRPIRILSPEEAAAEARDAPSHVWTEGVRPSDIPKLQPEPSTKHQTKKRAKSAKPATTETGDNPTVTPPPDQAAPSDQNAPDTTTAPGATPAGTDHTASTPDAGQSTTPDSGQLNPPN